jgi:DNA ligase-4
VYQSLENRCGKEGNCSIADINDYLDALNVAADRPAREAILRSMLKRTSANEQKWIVRIILKGTRPSIGHFHQPHLQLKQHRA